MTTGTGVSQQEVLRKMIGRQGGQADADILRVLGAVVTLEPGESNEAHETRVITIQEDTDGSVTADSWKPYNLIRVSYRDLIGFLLKESTILLTEDTRVKVVMSLLNLLFDFVPRLTYRFNEQDAGLLLTIWRLNGEEKKEEVSVEEVAAAHERFTGQPLDLQRIRRSLAFFHDLHVLRYLGDGRYRVRERMIYERN